MTSIKEIILKTPRPAIIAGPCSAESREQIINTAEGLVGTSGLIAFRAGLWKPRTRPGDFEGVGEKGLDWMKEVKEKTNLKLAVEVAVPWHVEKCLKAGIDILWIGARTVVSPFMVDEIASALKGSNVCVMVKNPVNPDLSLWSGGIERLLNASVKHLAAIHRGFDVFSSDPFRNLPLWEIPIGLKQQFPEIPVLCDPSHIAGKRELLQVVSQKALDRGFDGLMIESHIDPDKALTDPLQQISPASLKKLSKELVIKDHIYSSSDHRLDEYRSAIDEIDNQLLELLSRRMDVSSLIGELKKQYNLAPYQPERWQSLLNDRLNKGASLHLNEHFVKKIFEVLHMESIKRQE